MIVIDKDDFDPNPPRPMTTQEVKRELLALHEYLKQYQYNLGDSFGDDWAKEQQDAFNEFEKKYSSDDFMRAIRTMIKKL
jgi:hypothetical protein